MDEEKHTEGWRDAYLQNYGATAECCCCHYCCHCCYDEKEGKWVKPWPLVIYPISQCRNGGSSGDIAETIIFMGMSWEGRSSSFCFSAPYKWFENIPINRGSSRAHSHPQGKKVVMPLHSRLIGDNIYLRKQWPQICKEYTQVIGIIFL